jgi:hypothetical protein
MEYIIKYVYVPTQIQTFCSNVSRTLKINSGSLTTSNQNHDVTENTEVQRK